MAKQFLRRKQYIVRKRFQLRYIGLILAVMLFSVIITGYTIYYNSWTLLGDKLANVYPQGRLVSIFKIVNLKLAVSMIFVTLLCTGIGIIASHKIAGPIYRMINFIDDVTAGDYAQRLRLRKNDELNDVADALNRLVDRLEKEKKS